MRRKFCRNSMACSWKRVVLLPLPLWILLCYLLYQSTTGPVGSRSDLFRLRNNKRGNWDTSSTIHLGFVLRGERVFLRAVTLLKNIFYYQGRINDPSGSCVVRNYGSSGHVCRKEPIPGFNPVHVHIVADNETRKMAHSCFTNASLPAFSWSLYDITPYLSFVEEFPNGHDTGPSAMVKITWPFILEKDVDRFITLDTDTLFNHNIAELWSYFDRFNDEQVLGLAYEATASSAYFQPDAQHPYADGGLNSGVILWYMKRIRLLPWEQLVRTGVLLQLREHSTLNGDQSVFNGIITHNPKLYFNLNCEWHVQLWNEHSAPACPVVWPERDPDELDCISTLGRLGTNTQPNLLRLAHFNTAPKPETDNWTSNFQVEQASLTRVDRSLGITKLRARFYTVYKRFRDLPITCFR